MQEIYIRSAMQNAEFDLAEQFALYTNKHFFLTGKAGSGKTTLLRQIAKKTTKNFVVVAPTGVAAINAGGVTIHSQFNLPLTSFIPNSDAVNLNLITNRRALVEHLQFRREKRKVIQEMELLIVDEVSMVRADILDAMDFVMRTVRRNQKPFGGVQVMLIGDMHQLPPVVKEQEWAVLKNYYPSPYFFDSLVWKQLNAAEIELKKIYRQSDRKFVQLLNNIRHRQMDESDYEALKERYQPDFRPQEGYILLSTHNNKANQVNEKELQRLDARPYGFEAEITGDFPEHIYPCDRQLILKEGAQVMFTRNDAEGGKYFNGKLAKVTHIDGKEITVTFNDSGEEYLLKKEVWENVTYTVDEKSDKIDKDVTGTFSQYPLRLAWAITIHKSQGLTFDKVIIDAGHSFAAGQVYVALSRCRTLEGIVLHSLITQNSLHGDEKITDFSESHHGAEELKTLLEEAKVEYANYQLKRLFDFHKLRERIAEWKEVLFEKEIPEKEKALALFDTITTTIESIVNTSINFEGQLNQLLREFNRDATQVAPVLERGHKAVEYFTHQIFNGLIGPLHNHIAEVAYKSKVKRYVEVLQYVKESFWSKTNQLYQATFMDQPIYTGSVRFSKTDLKPIQASTTSGKKEKGGTFKDTLDLQRQGKSIEEIATIRSLTVGTIKGHLARWIQSGDLNIYDVLPADTVDTIAAFLQNSEEKTVAAVFRKYGEKYDGNEVRMVLAHVLRRQQNAL
ncbi:MAG: AAA family ATPase [Bacteroidetes bacterium]|nr:AAA family ATPase [Bacteroidota bacterium]